MPNLRIRPEITSDDYDRILAEIIDEAPASHLLSIPGVYEAVQEEFNNEIIDRWAAEVDAQQGGLTVIPTLYELEPIGVAGAYEAVASLHFCSEDCRERYPRVLHQRYSEGYEAEPGVLGECCEHCGRVLPETGTGAVERDKD